MKTRYEYIHFKLDVTASKGRKTNIYAILSKSSNHILGYIKWYGAWRQYCFYPNGETVYNVGCLDDIKDFIKQLMER